MFITYKDLKMTKYLVSNKCKFRASCPSISKEEQQNESFDNEMASNK